MSPQKKLSLTEFVALMAVLIAGLAFAIDAMLPAVPSIAAELTPDAPNRASMIVLTFMLGIGLGTLVSGPLSDAYGRKPIIVLGVCIFVIGAGFAYFAQTMEQMMAARVLQGIGAAGPRIVPLAMVRDLYEGRHMAQVTSFIMSVFMLVPAVAPAIGALLIDTAGWRSLFVAFSLFSLIGMTWLLIRQPETLARADRRPLRPAVLRAAFGEVVSNKMVMRYTAVLTLSFVMLFSLITNVQPVYDQAFGRGDEFPMWFAISALASACGTVLNARMVIGMGMRRLAYLALGVQMVLSGAYLIVLLVLDLPQDVGFYISFLWTVSLFSMVGFTLGNLNALALQPLGHIAGMAASVIAAISTVIAVAIAIPVGLAFDGTPLPLVITTFVSAVLAWTWMRNAQDPVPAPTG